MKDRFGIEIPLPNKEHKHHERKITPECVDYFLASLKRGMLVEEIATNLQVLRDALYQLVNRDPEIRRRWNETLADRVVKIEEEYFNQTDLQNLERFTDAQGNTRIDPTALKVAQERMKTKKHILSSWNSRYSEKVAAELGTEPLQVLILPTKKPAALEEYQNKLAGENGNESIV